MQLDKSRQIRDKNLMRIMGLDVGSHTIGVAISDALGLTAQALKTIQRRSLERDVEALHEIVKQFEVSRIVVGLPKNMNGTLGEQAEKVLKWVKTLEENLHLPVSTWDERLSTVGATKILLEADLSRKKRKKTIDRLAAALILQGYLDYQRQRNDDPIFPT